MPVKIATNIRFIMCYSGKKRLVKGSHSVQYPAIRAFDAQDKGSLHPTRNHPSQQGPMRNMKLPFYPAERKMPEPFFPASEASEESVLLIICYSANTRSCMFSPYRIQVNSNPKRYDCDRIKAPIFFVDSSVLFLLCCLSAACQ